MCLKIYMRYIYMKRCKYVEIYVEKYLCAKFKSNRRYKNIYNV